MSSTKKQAPPSASTPLVTQAAKVCQEQFMLSCINHPGYHKIQGYPLEGVYCWLDSSVTLHWIKGGEDQKQFVSDRVWNIQWRHVGTKENPADLGSCGRGISKCLDLWWHGPSWLPYQHRWLENTVTTPTKETQAEAKIRKSFWT